MPPRICLVDDDECICDSLSALFSSRNLRLSVYRDPTRFLSSWISSSLRDDPAAIIIDIRMPGLSGLELFARMRLHGLPCHHAVIFLTGHGDIPSAVDCIKSGAYDYLEKPFSDNAFVDRVLRAVAWAQAAYAEEASADHEMLTSLTPREREIAERIVLGRTNAAIAAELFISVRTVEVHRASMFRKLDIKTAVELVPLVTAAVARTTISPARSE
jgi:two-component system response regulator DctR